MRELFALLANALRAQTLPALSGSHLAPGGAAGAGGGRSPHSHSSSGSHSPPGVSSRKALSMAAQEALLTEFAAEPGAPPLPATPFPISRLQSRGIYFAHRTRASIGEAGAGSDPPVLADFNTAPGGLLLPADPSKGSPGMSFFIVTRETPAVLRAAHAFRGVAPGRCSAYPLDKLPAALSLVVDRVQLCSARGEAVMLHASLAPAKAMSEGEFLAALRQWEGVQLCAMEGSASGALDCLYEPGGEEEACAWGSCPEAHALVASGARKLAAELARPAAAQPAGGSPGAQQDATQL